MYVICRESDLGMTQYNESFMPGSPWINEVNINCGGADLESATLTLYGPRFVKQYCWIEQWEQKFVRVS